VTSAGGANFVATAAAGDGAARDGAYDGAAAAGTAAAAEAAAEADLANRYRRRPRPSPCAGGPCAGLSGV